MKSKINNQKEVKEKMRKKEELGMKDQIILVCKRKDGSIKWITDTAKENKSHSMAKTGMAEVAGLILTDVGGTAFDYVGIGTSTAAESADHTDLQTPVKRKAGTGTRQTTTFTNDTAQLVATFSSADGLSGSSAIAEAGVFNASTAGTMLFRKIFTAKTVNWNDGDTLEVTAKCQMKQGA
jgi:hypothetical protein